MNYIDFDGLTPKKYTKPKNPNKKENGRSGTGTRRGDAGRERNRGIDEEHSVKPKGPPNVHRDGLIGLGVGVVACLLFPEVCLPAAACAAVAQ